MDKLNALCIGAGSIGALKPDKFDSPISENILTHCKAYDSHPDIHLVGVVDIDGEKAVKAARKWDTEYYFSIAQAFKENKIDIVSVCTPTNTHYNVMAELFYYDFKLLIAEKPFCVDSTEAKIIKDSYKAKNKPILIDYIRHFEPEYKKLKDQIAQGILKPVFAHAIYNRGLRHEGCHAIALFNYLFGKYKGGSSLTWGFIEEMPGDMSITAQLSFEKCPSVILTPTDGRDYSIFDIDIFFKDRRINFSEHGLYMDTYLVAPEKVYGNYNALPNSCTRKRTKLKTCLLEMVNNAVNHLKHGEKLICTPEDAINVHKIIEGL